MDTRLRDCGHRVSGRRRFPPFPGESCSGREKFQRSGTRMRTVRRARCFRNSNPAYSTSRCVKWNRCSSRSPSCPPRHSARQERRLYPRATTRPRESLRTKMTRRAPAGVMVLVKALVMARQATSLRKPSRRPRSTKEQRDVVATWVLRAGAHTANVSWFRALTTRRAPTHSRKPSDAREYSRLGRSWRVRVVE